MERNSSHLFLTCCCFVLLCVLFIPFPFHLFPLQQPVVDLLFKKPLHLLAAVFGYDINGEIYSDSITMYLLVIVLAFISFIVAAVLKLRLRKQQIRKFISITHLIAVYYLALLLIKYGADKILKAQFYLPEPNILYSPFGSLTRDTLFWSTMGTSYSFSMLTGIIEATAGILLLFRRTRIIGMLVAIAVLINIVIINFSFDISVKIFSLFLLMISVFLILPFAAKLLSFLCGGRPDRMALPMLPFRITPTARAGIKFLIIILFFVEGFFVVFTEGKFNDDNAKRPALHGAYEVVNDDQIKLNPIRRFFIHRDGYFILQDRNDKMKDYKLFVNEPLQHFELIDYSGERIALKYNFKDSVLNIQFPGETKWISAKTLNWRQLPAIRPLFHWYMP